MKQKPPPHNFCKNKNFRFYCDNFFQKIYIIKENRKQKLSEIHFSFFFYEFYQLIFFKKKELNFELKFDFHSYFLFRFLHRIGKKVTTQKKKILNSGNENLIYLNQISKFQIRQSISRILSKQSNQKFGLMEKKKFEKDVTTSFRKKIKNNISMVNISNERLRKIKSLFHMIKTRKVGYTQENFYSTIFIKTEWILPEKESQHSLLGFRKSGQKGVYKGNYLSLNNSQRKEDVKSLLSKIKNKALRKKKRYKGSEREELSNILFGKITIRQMFDSQINYIHFFCLMSTLLNEGKKKENINYDYNGFFLNQEDYLNNFNVDKKMKNSNKSNKSNLEPSDNIGKLFLEYFKKQNGTWKLLIFSIKNNFENLILKKKQKSNIEKLCFLIKKLKSSKLIRKELELKFQKQFRILRQNSIKIDLLVLKFSSLQRIFFYQGLATPGFPLFGNTKEELNKKIKKKIQFKNLGKLTERIRKMRKILKNRDCRRDRSVLHDLKRKLNCPVIDSLPKEIVLMNCGHLFSSKCVKNLIFSRNRNCPLCGTKFSNGSIRSVFFS